MKAGNPDRVCPCPAPRRPEPPQDENAHCTAKAEMRVLKKGSVVPKTYFNSEVLEYLGDKISNSPTPVSEETGTT